jgi:hypothetical protein
MTCWTNWRKLSRKTPKAFKETGHLAEQNAEAIRALREESKEQGIRFSAYQQASQWVVNLAFGLLAIATITTIVSAVVRR